MRAIIAEAQHESSGASEYSPRQILRQSTLSLRPLNGKVPVSSLYITTPRAQISALWPVQPPLDMISGDMQCGVPQKSQWIWLSMVLKPKSISLIRISLEIRMFSSLRSRCTMFFECRQVSALRISFMMTRTLSSLAFLPFCARKYSTKELFSTSSMTMLTESFMQMVSWYLMMLGCSICSITWISLRTLFMWEISFMRALSQIFIAQTPPFQLLTSRTEAQVPLPMTPPTRQVPIIQKFWLMMFCSDLMRSRRWAEVCFIILLLILGNSSGFSSSVIADSCDVKRGRILLRFFEFSLSFSRLTNFLPRSSISQRLVFRIVFFKLGSLTGRPSSIPNPPLPLAYSVRMCGSNFTLSSSQLFSINYYIHNIPSPPPPFDIAHAHSISAPPAPQLQTSQYVRVVKEADSKSAGFSRAGSNPAADAFCISSVCPFPPHGTPTYIRNPQQLIQLSSLSSPLFLSARQSSAFSLRRVTRLLRLTPYFSSISLSKFTFQKIRRKVSCVRNTSLERVRDLTEACLGVSLMRAIYPKASPSLQHCTMFSSWPLNATSIPSRIMQNLEPTSPSLMMISPSSQLISVSTSQIFSNSSSENPVKNCCFFRAQVQMALRLVMHIFLQ